MSVSKIISKVVVEADMVEYDKPDNEGRRVIVKFLVWYESLTPRERVLFELQLGKVIRSVKDKQVF